MNCAGRIVSRAIGGGRGSRKYAWKGSRDSSPVFNR
jgi:hypothetical protein